MHKRINNFDVIANYRVIKMIANGGFGTVYFVRELGSNMPMAMKVEKGNKSKSSIEIEYSILKQLQSSLYFPHLFGHGTINDLSYIVMELLGPSLSRVKSYLPEGKFSLSTSLRLGIEIVCLLREFHARGFVHRDIKPANFLIRPDSPSPICLIDFGLSKRFIDPVTSKPHKMRTSESYQCFIGTSRYASINAHKRIDLGPRDDMICWFNMMVELINGELPWSHLNDKNEILKKKEEILHNPEERCKNLPIQFISIYDEIIKLKYDEFPDYDMILLFLSDALRALRQETQKKKMEKKMKKKKKNDTNSNENDELNDNNNEADVNTNSNESNDDNEINEDGEDDSKENNNNEYNGEEPYDWEKLSDHQIEELFPPSVMNSRRICRNGFGSFYSSSASINMNTNSGENTTNINSPNNGNSEKLGFEFDNMHQKNYTQNQAHVEKFHLLADPDEINTRKKCFACCGCGNKFSCSIC